MCGSAFNKMFSCKEALQENGECACWGGGVCFEPTAKSMKPLPQTILPLLIILEARSLASLHVCLSSVPKSLRRSCPKP